MDTQLLALLLNLKLNVLQIFKYVFLTNIYMSHWAIVITRVYFQSGASKLNDVNNYLANVFERYQVKKVTLK